MDDLDSLCLVKECRDLEECFDTHFTDAILVDADEVDMREVKTVIKHMDWEDCLWRCDGKASLIVEVVKGSWIKLWDAALDLAHVTLRDFGLSLGCWHIINGA